MKKLKQSKIFLNQINCFLEEKNYYLQNLINRKPDTKMKTIFIY